MKKILAILIALPTLVYAQSYDRAEQRFNASNLWKDIQIGATAGSSGIGLDVKTSVAPFLGLRVGFNCMPRITKTSGFSMTSVGGSTNMSQEKMKHLAECLADLVGNPNVDEIVDMQFEASFVNAKILLDCTPFRNKHWRITAGIYAGGSQFAKVCNTIKEGSTTTAMLLYNKMYDESANLGEYEYPSISVGNLSFELDPATGQALKDRFKKYGRVAVQVGELKDGTPYTIEPDEDGLLKAEGETNKVKPYLGFGYDTTLGGDHRWRLGVDAGAMYWGTPHIYHNDVCLVHDLKNIRGVVGSYVSLAKHLPVYPILELRLGYRLYR